VNDTAKGGVTAASQRWRGFNILDLFSTSNRWDDHFPMAHGPAREEYFAWIREWGFNFARLPMSYLYFLGGRGRSDWSEKQLAMIDPAVEYADKYGVHLSLNLHRAPGFCVTSYPFDHPEPDNLFKDEAPLKAFISFWEIMADRYKGVSSEILSFNLVNEPLHRDYVTMPDVQRVYAQTIKAIRAVDADRLVLLEGEDIGEISVGLPDDTFSDPQIGASVHWYSPILVSHYDCPWSFRPKPDMVPTWPLVIPESFDGKRDVWDRDRLRDELAPWFDLRRRGIRVHLGETGAYRNTPHDVYLAWLGDLLGVLAQEDIGWCLWNIEGTFGVLETGRDDVDYVDFHGKKLDRKLLELLQRY